MYAFNQNMPYLCMNYNITMPFSTMYRYPIVSVEQNVVTMGVWVEGVKVKERNIRHQTIIWIPASNSDRTSVT